MKQRSQLHSELCEILGTTHAYYQPPESLKLTYPCFVYELNPGGRSVTKADNSLYRYEARYQLIYITDDSETNVPLTVLRHFPLCSYDRMFVSDRLYHHVFDLYY